MFCFCGGNGEGEAFNTIESIKVGKETEWRVLAINHKIARTFDLAAVPLRSSIIVFGGN